MEYAGEAIRALSMEGRMTVCNMSIEGGARAGMIAPDEKTYAYLKDRPKAPKGEAWDAALRYWETLHSDDGALFDTRDQARCREPAADRHLGHEPGGRDLGRRRGAGSGRDRRGEQAPRRNGGRSNIWASSRARKITDITLDRVFIGSCTNGRIEDLRAVAKIVEGKHGRTTASTP